MERLIERLRVARKALSTLQELTKNPELSIVERDAAIQRFESLKPHGKPRKIS
ncbi:MAG: hypothetical protein LDL50_03825 [Chloroflexi bacterium]|nr:hypothetical protein [Chloroflexota bacterium]MCA2002229.1 hypothetical protein [Chloroflexota bacterium]